MTKKTIHRSIFEKINGFGNGKNLKPFVNSFLKNSYPSFHEEIVLISRSFSSIFQQPFVIIRVFHMHV